MYINVCTLIFKTLEIDQKQSEDKFMLKRFNWKTFGFLDRSWPSPITTAKSTENQIFWSWRWHSAEILVIREDWNLEKNPKVRDPQIEWHPKYEYNFYLNLLIEPQLCMLVRIQRHDLKTDTNQRGLYSWKTELANVLPVMTVTFSTLLA